MRAVVQRVENAKITINNCLYSSIGRGLLVFLGIEKGDGVQDADYLVEKIINLRIFEDSEGKMNRSLIDNSGGLLVVSQFTIVSDCRKGRRPSFVNAEEPEKAKGLYDYFIDAAKRSNTEVASGQFQAMMKVELVNDGPVTIIMDSKKNG